MYRWNAHSTAGMSVNNTHASTRTFIIYLQDNRKAIEIAPSGTSKGLKKKTPRPVVVFFKLSEYRERWSHIMICASSRVASVQTCTTEATDDYDAHNRETTLHLVRSFDSGASVRLSTIPEFHSSLRRSKPVGRARAFVPIRFLFDSVLFASPL